MGLIKDQNINKVADQTTKFLILIQCDTPSRAFLPFAILSFVLSSVFQIIERLIPR